MAGAVRTSPSVDNYTIGKGILEIATWIGGSPGAYSDVGNCTKFEFEMTEESKEHFASRTSTKEQDADIVIQTGYTLSFELDELSVENVRRFMKATMSGTKILYANMNANVYYALRFTADNSAGPNY
jgi:hypothetical protein